MPTTKRFFCTFYMGKCKKNTLQNILQYETENEGVFAYSFKLKIIMVFH